MTTTLILAAILAATVISAAWVIPRKRAARSGQETADDAAIRDLYDHYRAGVDSITQAYLRRAPSDEEWLAGIRAKAARQTAEPRKARTRLRAASAAIKHSGTRKYSPDARKAAWRRFRKFSLACVSAVVVGFCASRNPGVLLVFLAIGVVAGLVLGAARTLLRDSDASITLVSRLLHYLVLLHYLQRQEPTWASMSRRRQPTGIRMVGEVEDDALWRHAERGGDEFGADRVD